MKALKPIILIIAPIVLCVGIYMSFFSGPKNPGINTVEFVNVMTGELVSKSSTKVSGYPDLTDDDNKPYLYPTGKDSEGQTVVHERFRGILKEAVKRKELNEAQLKIDMSTFRIKGK